MELRSETWDAFWGRLLRIEYFEGKWDMYRKVADSRAEWLEQAFGLDKSRPLLSCACGEGGIELALARRGFNVTGIDRCSAFVHFAREQAAEGQLNNATFLSGDLRSERPLPDGFGTVCCFDTFGLLNDQQEQRLLANMAGALLPDGLLLVDSPQRDAQNAARTWSPVGDGHLLMETRWDAKAGMQHLEPLYIGPDGQRVNLQDPYDDTRDEHTGVIRYLYGPEELTRLVQSTGLNAQVVTHQRKGYYMVAARKG